MFRKLLGILACLFLLSVYMLIFVLLFILTATIEHIESGLEDVLPLQIILPTIINILLIRYLNTNLCKNVCKIFTDYENHNVPLEYESSYIFKIYLFEFISYCMPMLFISHINVFVGLHCFKDDCDKHSKFYFYTMYLILFLVNIIDKLMPAIRGSN